MNDSLLQPDENSGRSEYDDQVYRKADCSKMKKTSMAAHEADRRQPSGGYQFERHHRSRNSFLPVRRHHDGACQRST